MLTHEELRVVAEEAGTPLQMAERDYLQHIVLLGLSRRVAAELVLTGGGSLQKTLGLPRLSEDIDLVQRSKVDPDALMQHLQRTLANFGYRSQISPHLRGTEGWQRRFRVEGPLFDGGVHSAASVRLDVTLRDELALPPRTVLVTPRYRDVPPYTIAAIRPEELAAAKAAALAGREKARDLYDLWFLLSKGVELVPDLVARRVGALPEAAAAAGPEQALRRKRAIWLPELGALVRPLPRFEEAVAVVRPALEAAWPVRGAVRAAATAPPTPRPRNRPRGRGRRAGGG